MWVLRTLFLSVLAGLVVRMVTVVKQTLEQMVLILQLFHSLLTAVEVEVLVTGLVLEEVRMAAVPVVVGGMHKAVPQEHLGRGMLVDLVELVLLMAVVVAVQAQQAVRLMRVKEAEMVLLLPSLAAHSIMAVVGLQQTTTQTQAYLVV